MMVSKNVKMKWIKVFVVLGFIGIAAIAFNMFISVNRQNREQAIEVKTDTQNMGLQLYLVKDNNIAYPDEKAGLEKLELEDEPLLSSSDIISYNWDMHCIKIKNVEKINSTLLQRRFVMVADGERIYSGAFWSAVYSMIPPKISVYLENIDDSNGSIIVALGSWRPGGKIIPDVQKILTDSRIQKVLERDGLMYKAYKPQNFERPDYIEIIDNGESYGYGGVDWEKNDQLLQLLDKRFVKNLDYIRQDLSLKDDAALASLYKEMLIILEYDEQHEFIYNIRGADAKLEYKELIMPITGDYSDLLYFGGDNGYIADPLGNLERFTEIDMLKRDLPRRQRASQYEPEGIHLMYYKGGSFEYKSVCYYELKNDEANQVRNEADSGKLLKGIPGHNPQPTSLIVKFGKNDDRWFRIYNDGKTLFSNGKYYHNPALAGIILNIAKESCRFEIFDTSHFKGVVKAKYSFRTNTMTVERSTEDEATLAEMEKGLQKAQYNTGGGCPFSDGVLTLTFENGSVMGIS